MLMCGTYGAWMYASKVAQGLFFIAMLALMSATRQQGPRRYVVAGFLAGLTFLAHTAPAVILAATFGVQALWRWRRDGLPAAVRQTVAYGLAFVVAAAPLLWNIAAHYRLRILNNAPLFSEFPELTPAGFPGLLASLSPIIAVAAVVGLVVAARGRSPERWLIPTWVFVSAGLVLLGVVRHLPAIKPWNIHTPVPTFHWWLYLSAAMSLLFGVGLAAIVTRLPPRRVLWEVAFLAMLAAWAYHEWPRYRTNEQFTAMRHQAESRDPELLRMTQLLRHATGPGDVILATHGAGLLIVGPAGRRTVAIHPGLSNPYVDHAGRAADRDAMFQQLETGDVAGFLRTASTHRVTYVVGNGPDHCAAIQAGGGIALERVHQFERFCLFRVRHEPFS